MFEAKKLLALIDALRAEWAASGAATPLRDFPSMEFAYGVVHGRDNAAQMFREAIVAAMSEEEDKERM